MNKYFLIIIGLILIGTISFILIQNSQRSSALDNICSSNHVQDPELMKSVDFIYEKFKSMGFNFTDVRGCVNIQYQDLKSKGGPFAKFRLAEGLIYLEVDSNLKGKNNSLISAFLVHEIIHVIQFMDNKLDSRYPQCIDNEVEAFFHQIYFISTYTQDQANEALYLNTDAESQILKSVYSTLEISKKACSGSNGSEYNQCINKNLKDNLRSKILSMENYQKQCKL